MEVKDNAQTIQSLLLDFDEQRSALKHMIVDVEELKKDISKLFPERMDARYKRFFEEKVKTAVAMLNVLLDVRKELIKLTKDELEIRRRMAHGGREDLEEILAGSDIRSIARRVEKLSTKKSGLEKNLKVIPDKTAVAKEN